MAWWSRLFEGFSSRPDYEIPFSLYSEDGKRQVEVRLRRDGLAYFVERDWVEGTTFKDRAPGEEIGPFPTPEDAERAAVITPWFLGD